MSHNGTVSGGCCDSAPPDAWSTAPTRVIAEARR